MAQQNTRTCSTGGWSNPGFTCGRCICIYLHVCLCFESILSLYLKQGLAYATSHSARFEGGIYKMGWLAIGISSLGHPQLHDSLVATDSHQNSTSNFQIDQPTHNIIVSTDGTVYFKQLMANCLRVNGHIIATKLNDLQQHIHVLGSPLLWSLFCVKNNKNYSIIYKQTSM